MQLDANNAFLLLHECGFQESKWEILAQFLCISGKERTKLKESVGDQCTLVLENCLAYWITQTSKPSWEELAKAVEKCGEMEAAFKMRRELNITGDSQGTVIEIFIVMLILTTIIITKISKC